MAHEVFISYSSKNAEYANAVHEKLESKGIKCWLDSNNIMTADNFAQEIIEGLHPAKVVVLIYSKDADESKYVYREIETASEANKHIVPLKIDDSFPDELKLFLRGTQWLDASPTAREKNGMALDDCYDQLMEAVERAIGIWSPQWVLEKGCDKTYYIKHSLDVERVLGDNDFEYSLVNTKEDVERNPSSYYYDKSSKKLFLHPKKNSSGEFLSPDFLSISIENKIPEDDDNQKGFLEKYGKYLAIAVVLLVVVGGFLAFTGMNDESSDSDASDVLIDIGYIGLQDNGGGSYSYYVYGKILENSNISSDDVIHIDFYDKKGNVVDSSDTKIAESDGNILGSVDVSNDDIAKISLKLQDSNKKVLYSQESDNIISE